MTTTVKLFVLGSTGYIGGDALYAIVRAHPEYEVTCLVRNSEKGALVASQYPTVKLVYGDLDDADLLRTEAGKADIVLNCASADHEGAAAVIGEGLIARAKADNHPSFYIHTSGSGILCFADLEQKTFGEPATKIYDDWDGLSEVTSLPDFAPHRNVDKAVLALSPDGLKIKTAIVAPPTIYGPGRGPGNQRSIQLEDLTKISLERGEVFQIGEGKTHWTNIHVHDLSSLFLRLVEEAANGGGKASWGKDGYYFAEHGEHIWGEISRLVAKITHKEGLLPSEKVSSVSGEEADKLRGFGAVLWGANSRCKAIRARKLLGWTPKERKIEDEVPDVVRREAKALGIIPAHAKVAAGEA